MQDGKDRSVIEEIAEEMVRSIGGAGRPGREVRPAVPSDSVCVRQDCRHGRDWDGGYPGRW